LRTLFGAPTGRNESSDPLLYGCLEAIRSRYRNLDSPRKPEPPNDSTLSYGRFAKDSAPSNASSVAERDTLLGPVSLLSSPRFECGVRSERTSIETSISRSTSANRRTPRGACARKGTSSPQAGISKARLTLGPYGDSQSNPPPPNPVPDSGTDRTSRSDRLERSGPKRRGGYGTVYLRPDRSLGIEDDPSL
jgi:hypothetical protein